MLIAAADYVHKVSKWLAKADAEAAAEQGGTSDDYTRQRPGSKKWIPPTPQQWIPHPTEA
jgi:hypothetical protein